MLALRDLERVRSKKLFLKTTMDKIFKTSSRFCIIPIFQEFFASIDKIFVLGGRLHTTLQIYEGLRFS